MRDFTEVMLRANDDFEFRREMRYYTGKLHVAIGDHAWLAHYDDGHMESLESAETDPGDAAISIVGTREQWEEMTALHCRPFYQSLQSSSIKHGVQLSNTHQFYAYLPAMNRLLQIFRELNTQGV